MSRRREVPKHNILPDPIYGSTMLAKFINMVMVSGKKSIAERIMFGALEEVKAKGHEDPMEVLELALENVRPKVEVKSRRVGGATYQVPVEVRASRRDALAMRWMIDAARKRSEKSMMRRMSAEILDAAENRGAAVRKREDMHRMAEANKAFSHFRW